MVRNTLIAFLVIAAAAAAWLGFERLRATPEPVASHAVVATPERPVPAPAPHAVAARAPVVDAAEIPPPFRDGDDDMRDPEQAKLEGIQKLDAKFMAERVVPEWAMQQEQKIAASFAPAALKNANAPVPLAHEASCRSTTCKVTATYKSEMDAQVAHLNLMASLPNLNHSVMGQLQGPDGTVQLVVYASASTGPPPPPMTHH